MQRRCVPSPLVGEGQGGGSVMLESRLNPHPNPPHKGEGARRASGPLVHSGLRGNDTKPARMIHSDAA